MDKRRHKKRDRKNKEWKDAGINGREEETERTDVWKETDKPGDRRRNKQEQKE